MEDVKKLLMQKYMMPVSIVKKRTQSVVKIEKIEDYYNFFVAMLRTEDTLLQNMEHLWILGINEHGYSSCAYLVGYGGTLTFDYAASSLFKTSLNYQCEKVVMCCYRNTSEKIKITDEDIAFANFTYHRAEIVGIELLDYIVISSEFDRARGNPPPPDYETLLKLDLMKELAKDISYTPYIELKDRLDEEKAEHGKEMQQKRNIEIAIKMLVKGKSIDEIIELTDLTAEEISKIKSEM